MAFVYDGSNYQRAAGDTSGRTYTIEYSKSGHTATQVTADGNIKASAGVLYGVVIAGAGVTAGNTVVIKDGSGGATKFTLVFGAANETVSVMFSVPVTFATAIYADVTISGGSVYVTGIYD